MVVTDIRLLYQVAVISEMDDEDTNCVWNEARGNKNGSSDNDASER
jgi:hypothetical protein